MIAVLQGNWYSSCLSSLRSSLDKYVVAFRKFYALVIWRHIPIWTCWSVSLTVEGTMSMVPLQSMDTLYIFQPTCYHTCFLCSVVMSKKEKSDDIKGLVRSLKLKVRQKMAKRKRTIIFFACIYGSITSPRMRKSILCDFRVWLIRV